MRSQHLKDWYYSSLGKLSFLSLGYHRLRASKFRNSFVNIGSGEKYVQGMINIDGNMFRKKDIWLDVTLGLPFFDNSVSGIYASHIVEHFNIASVRILFSEFHRVLRSGGGVRIIVPSLEHAIRAYVDGESFTLSDWPEKYNSIGGRFNNFMLCANQHMVMFDFSLLEELLTETGFKKISSEKAHMSSYFDQTHMRFEPDNDPNDSSLYVECCK